MSDTNLDKSRHYNTAPRAVESRSGSSSLFFIVGGLVVAVALLFVFFVGDDVAPATAADPQADLSVTIEENAPAVEQIVAPEVDVEAAPAADAEPAPAADAAPAAEDSTTGN